MKVEQIIKEYLKENEYGGLTNGCCQCTIDDLMPCYSDGSPAGCEPFKIVAENSQADFGKEKN